MIKRILQRLFPVGTRSLLFGVHQVFWHPWTVYRAWVALYGQPSWRELVCIFIHDWGYWGRPNMDGTEGERHPEVGAAIAGWLFGPAYADLVLLHSRHYARTANEERSQRWHDRLQRGELDPIRPDEMPVEPSRLCWADKLSHMYEWPGWYLFRARLSGEIKEYRGNADRSGFIPLSSSDREWFALLQQHLEKLGKEQRATAVPYTY